MHIFRNYWHFLIAVLVNLLFSSGWSIVCPRTLHFCFSFLFCLMFPGDCGMQVYVNSHTCTQVLFFADISLTVLISTQIAFAWYGKNCGYLRSKVIKLYATGLHLPAAAVNPGFVTIEVQQKHFLCSVFCLFCHECFSSETLMVAAGEVTWS